MPDLPFMPVETGALLADAGDLPNELFGAYCRLLFRWWREGAMPEKDERRLARWAGLKSTEFDDLKEFLTHTEDGWIQKRLMETHDKILEKSAKAKNAAAARWSSERNADASAEKRERNANHNHNQSRIINDPDTRARGARKNFGMKKIGNDAERRIVPIPPSDDRAREVFDFVVAKWGEAICAAWFCARDGASFIRMNCTAVVISPDTGVRADRIRQQYWPAIRARFGEGVRFESAGIARVDEAFGEKALAKGAAR